MKLFTSKKTKVKAAALAGLLSLGSLACHHYVKPTNPGCDRSYIFESSRKGIEYDILVCERDDKNVLIVGERGKDLIYLKKGEAGIVPEHLVLDNPVFWSYQLLPLTYRWNDEIVDYFEDEVPK